MMTFFLIFLNGCVFLLPAAANLVEHAGSVILSVLILAGLAAWVTRSNRTVFDLSEKIVMVCFAAYFLVCLLFLLGHGLFNDAIPLEWKLDHEIRLMAFIPIFYLFLRAGINSGALWYGLSFAGIASGAYAIFYIYIFQKGVRATGAYHAIAFGDISLAIGFMGMAGLNFFSKKSKFFLILPILGIIGSLIATTMSATRGAFIAVPALMVPLLFQMGQYRRSWLMRASMIALLTALIFSTSYLPASLMSNRIRDGVREAVAFYNGQDSQWDAPRLKMWSESIDIIKQHPFTGVGRGGYRAIIREKALTNPKLEGIKNHSTPHNLFLTNMVDYGWIGLVILFGVFYTPLLILIPATRQHRSPVRDLGYAGITLIIAFTIFAFTETIFFRNIYISFYVILMAAILALCRNYRGLTYEDF